MVVAVNQDERKWFQILAIFTSCLISFVSGNLLAWPSPFILKITQDKKNYNISEAEASYFTVIHPLGVCVLSPFFVPVVNNIGKKKTTLLAAIPIVTALLLKAFATNLWLLYLSRFIFGIGDAMQFLSVPAYIGEISTPKVRGVWGNVFICSVFFGQFIMNILGSYLNVRDTSLILLIFPVIFLLTFTFMPESPYFNIGKGRYDEAKNNLRKLRRKQNVDAEFEAIKSILENQLQNAGTWKDLIGVKVNRRALFTLSFLRISQALTGIYVFASYTQFLFEKAGGSINPQTSSILFTGLTFIMYATSSSFTDLLGRRKAYTLSIFLCGIVALAEAIYFLLDLNYPAINLESMKWFPLAGMLLFVIVSSFGCGVVPTLMYSELFSPKIKAHGIAIVTVIFSLMILLANNVFYYLNSYTGLYGPFFLFASCNFLSTVISYFLIPETKGKTLEEIQKMLNKM